MFPKIVIFHPDHPSLIGFSMRNKPCILGGGGNSPCFCSHLPELKLLKLFVVVSATFRATEGRSTGRKCCPHFGMQIQRMYIIYTIIVRVMYIHEYLFLISYFELLSYMMNIWYMDVYGCRHREITFKRLFRSRQHLSALCWSWGSGSFSCLSGKPAMELSPAHKRGRT